ncbi:MAG TPA: hypothetical protein VF589_05180, partial [Allosphingosinicella sp.]
MADDAENVRGWARRRLAALEGAERPEREARGPSFFKRLALREAERVENILAADKIGAERKTGPSRRQRARMVVPTDERIGQASAGGEQLEWVNPAEIDSAEQAIGLTRRFKSSHLDRLYRNGKLSWVQWYAGDWYRNQHARCSFALSVVASYGGGTGGGEPSYGLPRTEAQLRARQLYMEARCALPAPMLGFMERMLIHDELPRAYGGKQRMRSTARIAAALDALAGWLGLAAGQRLVRGGIDAGVDRAGTAEAAAEAVVRPLEQRVAAIEAALDPVRPVDPAFLDDQG